MGDNNYTDRAIDFLFDKKELVYLALIVFAGAIIRGIIAGNIGPNADEAVYGTHAIDIIKSGAINNQNQSIVWFYLQDIFYRILGVTLFSARFCSFFFGTLTIIAVFLAAKEISNKRTALLAAFFYALSPFACREMLMEMDPTATFFAVFAIYFFIKGLKQNKISIIAFVVAGIGYMTKAFLLIYIITFIAIYILYYFISTNEKKNLFLTKKNIKRLIWIIFILVLIILPILTYNYLLYQEKGLTDIMFVRFLGTNNEMFKSIIETVQPFILFGSTGLITYGLGASIKIFFNLDPLLFLLFLFGAVYAALKKNKKAICLIFTFIPAYLFSAGTIGGLVNHYVYYVPLFAVIAAILISEIIEKLKSNKAMIMKIVVILFVFYSLFMLWPHLTSTSGLATMRDYAIKNIDDNSLVIADARIYRGQIAWMFNDKHYIEASLFNQLNDAVQQSSQQTVPVKTYFIECTIDDCGWGTITPGVLNDSMESMIGIFANMSKSPVLMPGGGGYGIESFNVYETTLLLKPAILDAADTTHMWFYYPVRWKLTDQIYDSYTPKTLFDKALNSFSYLILWLEIIFVFVLVVILVKRGYEEAI